MDGVLWKFELEAGPLLHFLHWHFYFFVLILGGCDSVLLRTLFPIRFSFLYFFGQVLRNVLIFVVECRALLLKVSECVANFWGVKAGCKVRCWGASWGWKWTAEIKLPNSSPSCAFKLLDLIFLKLKLKQRLALFLVEQTILPMPYHTQSSCVRSATWLLLRVVWLILYRLLIWLQLRRLCLGRITMLPQALLIKLWTCWCKSALLIALDSFNWFLSTKSVSAE